MYFLMPTIITKNFCCFFFRDFIFSFILRKQLQIHHFRIVGANKISQLIYLPLTLTNDDNCGKAVKIY